MNINEQRATAIRLAKSMDATKTVAMLESDDYQDIEAVTHLAVSEVGVEKFVEAVHDGYPGWASYALRFVNDLGSARGQLIDIVAETAVATESVSPEALVTGGSPVGSLTCYLAPGAAMVGWFTMFWIHEGQGYPQTTTRDSGKWLWSGQMSVSINRQYTIDCDKFATHIGAPLAAGDSVWMEFNACSQDDDTGFRFVYQPGGPWVQIDVVGAALEPKFSIHSSD